MNSADGSSPVTSAATAGSPYVDDLDRLGERWSRNRRRWIRALLVLYLTVPFWSSHLYSGSHSLSPARLAFLAAASVGKKLHSNERMVRD